MVDTTRRTLFLGDRALPIKEEEAMRSNRMLVGAATATVQPAAIPELPEEKPLPSENSPTSGTESAGVGPSTIGEKVLDKGDGLKSETRSVTGEKRTVRIVAPNLAPNLAPSLVRP